MTPVPDKDKVPGEDSAELPHAPSSPPVCIGRYQVLRELGRGGFGIVYLATDPRIGRKVAVKTILITGIRDSSEGQELYDRLCREAQAGGSLTHPGIVGVYELAEEGDKTYIVMEYVEGKTLAEMMSESRQGMPLLRALDVLRQAALALDFAHRKSVIHRDIKPANIMVDGEGVAKIADFGVAKVLTAVAQTKSVASLGTPYYMAPEQIYQGPVDGRTDQFALGVIAYELITGKRPFTGDSFASLMHQILQVEPSRADALNREVGPAVADVLAKALAKEPASRYATCTEFLHELANAITVAQEPELEVTRRIGDSPAKTAPPPAVKRPARRGKYALAAALALLLAGGAGLWWFLGHRPSPLNLTRLTRQSGQIMFPNLSPDRRFLVYAGKTTGNWDIYVQKFSSKDALAPVSLNLTAANDNDDTEPALSADGKWIAFHSERESNGKRGGLFVMDTAGRNVREIAASGYNPAWSPDGTEICFGSEDGVSPDDRSSSNSRLWVADARTGARRLVYSGDAVQPSWSPHGHRIAYWFSHDGGMRDIATVAADGSGQPVRLTDDILVDWNPVWSPDGAYIYFASDRDGAPGLWRIGVDERTGRALSGPQLVTRANDPVFHISAAKDGSLAFVQRAVASDIQSVRFDHDMESVSGSPSPVTRSAHAVRPDISAGGDWLAFSSGSGKQEDIYVVKTDGSDYRPLLVDPFRDRSPRWSPDGKHIAFYSNRAGKWDVWMIGLDGQPPKQLTENRSRTTGYAYPVWSHDGQYIALSVIGANPVDVQTMIVPVAAGWNAATKLPPVTESNSSFTVWSWSPDGKRLAGFTRRGDGKTGGISIYTLADKKYEALTDFGGDPIWLHDNQRVLFYHHGKLYIVNTADRRVKQVLSVAPYDVAPHGFSISHDNRTIYFSMESAEGDIWLGTPK